MSIIDMKAVAKSNEAEANGKSIPSGEEVSDAERLGSLRVTRVSDEGRRDIDGMHPRPEPHKLARVRPLAAADIEPRETMHRR
jgi:hypothetical protein